MIKVKIIKPCMSGDHLYEVIDPWISPLRRLQHIYKAEIPEGFRDKVEEIPEKWAKLTDEQREILGMKTSGLTLIDYSTTPVNVESFYYNAERCFSEEELDEMPWFGTHLFEGSFRQHA